MACFSAQAIFMLLLAFSCCGLCGRELTQATTSASEIKVAYQGCPRYSCPSSLAWKSGTTCTWTYPPMICCGGDSGIKTCPTLACANAFTYAVAGPNQCAFAEAMVAAISYSPTIFTTVKDYAYKKFTYVAKDAGMAQDAFFDAITAVAVVIGKAVSLSTINGFQLVCLKPSWPSCGGCTACNAANGTASVKALAQSTARSVSIAVAEAWYQAFSSDTYTESFAGEAGGVSVAVADAVDVAIATLPYQTFRALTENTCSTVKIYPIVEKAVAKTVACAIVKATNMYWGDSGVTYTPLSSDSSYSETTESQSALGAAVCVDSVSGAVASDSVSLLQMAKICLNGVGKCNCPQGQVPNFCYSNGKVYCIPYGLTTYFNDQALLPSDYQPLRDVPAPTAANPLSTLTVPSVSVLGVVVKPSIAITAITTKAVLVSGTTVLQPTSGNSMTFTIPIAAKVTALQFKCSYTAGSAALFKATFTSKITDLLPTTKSIIKLGPSKNVQYLFGAYYSGPGSFITQAKIEVMPGLSFTPLSWNCVVFKVSTSEVAWPPASACDGTGCV